MSDLFTLDTRQNLRDGAVLLRGRALAVDRALLDAIERVVAQSAFRRMVTPRRLPDVGGDDQLRPRRLGH
jgi:alkylated DNA repair protein (DNA oxidative demethylase)